MKRKVHLEALRIIACFSVLVNHTNNLVFWWQATPYSETWFVSMFYFFATKIAVPLFLMISGAVLLGKEESIKDVLKKRVLRIAGALLLFSFLTYLVRLTENPEATFSLLGFFESICQAPFYNAYWYLYTYLGLMLLVPFLRKSIPCMKKMDYVYLISVFAIVCGLLPILNHYWGFPAISDKFTQTMFPVYIIYFYLGYFMEHMVEDERYTAKGAVVALGIYLAITVACTYALYYEYAKTTKYIFFLDDVSLITIMIQAICVYYIVRVLFKAKRLADPNNIFCRLVSWIGGCTFGIYLVGDYLIGIFQPMYLECSNYMNRIPAVIIYELVVFIVGLGITMFLRKLPIFRKLI